MLKRLVLISGTAIVVGVAGAAIAVYWFLGGDQLRTALEQQGTEWLGQRVAIGTATARILPRPSITLHNVRIGDPIDVTLDDIELSTGLKPLWSRRIEDAEVVVSNSRIEMPLPFSVPAAAATEPAAGGEASPRAAWHVVSIRSIALRNITLASRGRELTISANSSLSSAHLNLDRFVATTGGTSLNASGLVQLAPRFDAQLRVLANRLDVDDLVALANAFTPRGATSSPATARVLPGRIVARVSAERGRAGGVDVQQFAATLVAQGSRITLSPMTFELFGGRYQGSFDIDSQRQGLQATVRAGISGIDVSQLAAFGGAADTITGRLSGAGTFNGRGATLRDAIAAAAGEGTVTIANGALTRLGLIRTVVLFFGRPASNAGASTDRFDRIDATFGLVNQVIAARALSLHSPDLDVVGQGTLTAPTRGLDGRFDLSLSEALSAQAGSDVARFTREGNRIVLPAIVGGTLDAPHVTIDAGAAVQRGLRNEVQRRLKGILGGLIPAPQD